MTWHPDMPAEYRDAIVTGDARELAAALPDESVDLIFTDPPYPREYLPLYGWLAETAARVLKPGGLCVAMAGQSWLPEIYTLMGGHLNYHWTLALDIIGGHATPVWPKHVQSYWKPLIAYVRGIYSGPWLSDVLRSPTRDKQFHEWGQSERSAISLITTIEPAATWEPFAGGGTVPAVCKMLGRSFVAFEIDADTAARARERVEQTQAMHPVLLGEQAEMELAV